MTQAKVHIWAVLLTIEEAAQMLNIGRSKTYELVLSGEIESVHIGRLRRVPAAAVEAYVERLLALPGGTS